MISPRNPALLGLFVFVSLLNFSRILPSSTQYRSQLYVKTRASSQFLNGSKIAQISSTTPTTCAVFCQLRSCQSFEFGCDDASAAWPCRPACRIYRNVAPKLEDKYFVNSTSYDYYEISFPLPPQDYPQCQTGLGCRPGVFCGKEVKRAPSPGQSYYTLTVRKVCYEVILNSSDFLNWEKSKTYCGYRGGKIVEPADWDEQKLLVTLMNRLTGHPNFLQPNAPPPTTVWLGCSGQKKDWKWTDGSEVTNTFWHGTNPDSLNDVNCCASLYTNVADVTFWIDRKCTDSTARVCVYDFAA